MKEALMVLTLIAALVWFGHFGVYMALAAVIIFLLFVWGVFA